MKKNYSQLMQSFIALLFISLTGAYAQQSTIQGTVSDKFEPLIGATVVVNGTTNGTTCDINGKYTLAVKPGTYKLTASFVGTQSQTKEVTVAAGQTATLDFTLAPSLSMNEIVVVGSRAEPRTLMETAVPVDIISSKEISNSSQENVGQILQYLAPSFNSSQQTISDGTDHIDPASLRGLGPDQVLVLVNGKRRHTSALLNVNGTVGKGTVGTDLNAIPAAAIERIEVLRDGAAAQYGSDAIAGVINIVLKKQVGVAQINSQLGVTSEGDGAMGRLGVNYGFRVGKKGFVNVTGEFVDREATNRSGDYTGTVYGDARDNDLTDFFAQTGLGGKRVMAIGNSAGRNGQVFFNAEVPIVGGGELYANGGFSFRKGRANGFYRFPKDQNRVVLSIYPNGFSPEIHTDIVDRSLTMGLRGEKNGWNLDFSNTRGANGFDFNVENSNNASLGAASPLSAYAGGFRYGQNTTNLDISRKLDIGFDLNVAFGAEFRLERYEIVSGEEASYINGGQESQPGVPGSAGIQVFPGFQPQNELNQTRTNTAGYIDLEADITEALLVGVAGRFESYSDFGDNFSWKTVARYKINQTLSLRAAFSTGFRAPSLHQYYFSNLSTQFITIGANQVPVQVGTFNNESNVARAFGIDRLKPEVSQNFSVGFTTQPVAGLSLTVDAYNIDIKDRIVLSGRFDAADYPFLTTLGAGAAQFFTNAVDTRTQGLDVVANYRNDLGKGAITLTAALNLNQTEVQGQVKTPPLLAGREEQLFNREEISRLEVVQPRSKLILSALYELGKFAFTLRSTRFGEVQFLHPNDGNPANWVVNEFTGEVETRDQSFSAKFVTDLDIAFKPTTSLQLAIGANNLLNVYPDKLTHSANTSLGRFVYSRTAANFGVRGMFLYGRVSLKF
ncbi:TonB-dependent receptor [Microscilla marina]|uniref:TonB-dependent receptor n=1 Tax=Microscilla marina ATCC 23134 TaxID=313606 RepID=A1ZHY4_MICM2|nr:TonB-dependent receptor [Microscilla marina]EAY30141.1 TonB-dependent receptor [Microscilla marina ATCC 23134]